MTAGARAVPTARVRVAAAAIALLSAAAVIGVGLVRGTFAVGGSDSSCYGLMAVSFAGGKLQPEAALARDAPWPDAPTTFAPAGFVPSPRRRDAASPVCSPGFSLLAAPLVWAFGNNALFVVSPLAGAVLIGLVFVFVTMIAGHVAGAAATVTTVVIPVLLFQVVQPMNDVAAAALWMAVLVAAGIEAPMQPWLMGAAAGLAVLVRPNLAPLALVAATWLAVTRWTALDQQGLHSARLRGSLKDVCGFASGFAPFLVLLLALNQALYAGVFRSGYGPAEELFALGHIDVNIRRYGRTLIETQLAWPLVGLAALVVSTGRARRLVWLAILVSGSTAAIYLPYRTFEEWWYVRFLLPAIVPLTALAAVVLWRGLSARSGRLSQIGAVAILLGVVVYSGFAARAHQVFELQRLERRFTLTGEVTRQRLSPNAVYITLWESGTVRFHADRPAILWDSLDPQWLDKAVAWLTDRGLEPYIIVEQWEEPVFRSRFSSHSLLGRLDWPPRFEIARQVRIFRPADRETYAQGGSVPSEVVW